MAAINAISFDSMIAAQAAKTAGLAGVYSNTRTQIIISALLARDAQSWRGDGIKPCEVVGSHFRDRSMRRVDFVLHELAHLLTYPECETGGAYFLALAALSVGDGGLTKIVAELVSKLSPIERTKNERDAIELIALFWLQHDATFPVERYIRDCIVGQDHADEFGPGDIDQMTRTVMADPKATGYHSERSRMLYERREHLHRVVTAWIGDNPAGKGWTIPGSRASL